jgi:hypothetical protein
MSIRISLSKSGTRAVPAIFAIHTKECTRPANLLEFVSDHGTTVMSMISGCFCRLCSSGNFRATRHAHFNDGHIFRSVRHGFLNDERRGRGRILRILADPLVHRFYVVSLDPPSRFFAPDSSSLPDTWRNTRRDEPGEQAADEDVKPVPFRFTRDASFPFPGKSLS